MNSWQFDTAKTKERYDRLSQYYQKTGLNADHFFCRHYAECSGSQKPGTVKQYAGGTAALAPLYDVLYKETPIRVLIIGKESSHSSDLEFGTTPNFDARSEGCLNTIYASKRTFHIKGTLLTLQRIFEVESDYLYACYALSNALRCGFQRAEVARNTSGLTDTPIMRKNCSKYLVDEIEILEPTLIITQGAWAVDGKLPLVDQLCDTLGVQKRLLLQSAQNGKYGLYEFPKFMLITSHHPARLNFWKAKYVHDSLWPMLDHLKALGYLPRIAQEDREALEPLIREQLAMRSEV
jgi:uracil-DNA glycosylase